jgi:hypothetical protein
MWIEVQKQLLEILFINCTSYVIPKLSQHNLQLKFHTFNYCVTFCVKQSL